MKLSKINKTIQNPEILGIFLKTRNIKSIKIYLKVKETRNLLKKSCDMVDSLLSNTDINMIVEKTSAKFNLIKYPIMWYALTRKYKPKIIVETGTSMGWSSFMILNALNHNEEDGHLYSFDLDDSESVKTNGGVGYLVPEYLKQNWTLIIGDIKKQLEPLFKKLGKIDMFIHDSEHSYEMMMYEYNLAWQYLTEKGILCSDDINHSDAFQEFIDVHKNEINRLNTFQEIIRSTDDVNLRPFVGYFFKSSSVSN